MDLYYLFWAFKLSYELLPWMALKGQIYVRTFKGLYLINGASYDNILYGNI